MTWNAYRVLTFETINRQPFEQMQDAIEFAKQQTDDHGSVTIRNGEVLSIKKRNLPCIDCKKLIECMPDETSPLCDSHIPF